MGKNETDSPLDFKVKMSETPEDSTPYFFIINDYYVVGTPQGISVSDREPLMFVLLNLVSILGYKIY